MIWLRIIASVLSTIVIVVQAFTIRGLRRTNRWLIKISEEQTRAFIDTLTDQADRAARNPAQHAPPRARRPLIIDPSPVGFIFPDPPDPFKRRIGPDPLKPPLPDPLKPPPKISKSTHELIGKVASDPTAPDDWGTTDHSFARVSKPSATPQPQRKATCIHCARPIMWLGYKVPMGYGHRDLGEWRDHAGKSICDGFIDGVKGHHKPK